MLTRRALADLLKAHENDQVLSVYLARETADPGERGAWRLRLEGALADVRASIQRDGGGDLSAFDRASAHVTSRVESFGRVLPSEGWSAFATGDELLHAEELPFAPPQLVRWQKGIRAAPYVRTLKAERPVALAVVDHWRGRIYTYDEGELTLVEELSADRTDVDASDVGVSKRAATSTGVRGATRTDYAQRFVERNAERLRRQIGQKLHELVGDHGHIVLGGTHKAIAALRHELDDAFSGRATEAGELSFDSTTDQLTAAVAAGASELTEKRQAELLEACGNSNGSLGWNETYRALSAGAVDTLLVARPWLESSPDDAEQLVRLALTQGASVEELGNELGRRLVADAEGVAARLRFKPAV